MMIDRDNLLKSAAAAVLGVALLGAAPMGLAQSAAEIEGAPDSLQLPSGSVGGGYYKVAGVVGKALEEELGVPVSAMPSSGSGENINLMERGDVQLALASSNTIWPAYTGSGQHEGRDYDSFRLVAKLYENPTVFYALESSGLDSVGDLSGRRVAVGSSPTAFDHITEPILREHGIDYESGIDKVYLGFGDAATQVSDGLVEASIATVGMPAIQQVASQNEIVYLTIDEEAIDRLSQQYPFFSKVTVEPNLLPGFEGEAYQTMDMGGPYLIAHKDLPEDFVYEIARALYEQREEIGEGAQELRPASENPEMFAAPLGEVPFHPGAERFWREQGLTQGD